MFIESTVSIETPGIILPRRFDAPCGFPRFPTSGYLALSLDDFISNTGYKLEPFDDHGATPWSWKSLCQLLKGTSHFFGYSRLRFWVVAVSLSDFRSVFVDITRPQYGQNT